MADDESLEEILNQISSAVIKNSEVLGDFLDKFEYHGKTISEWDDELVVIVDINPMHPDPTKFRQAMTAYAMHIQVANHLYSHASSLYTAIDNGANARKSDLVSKIVQDYKDNNMVRPAQKIIEDMAKQQLEDSIYSKTGIKIIKEFFKTRVDTLVEVRRALEQISLSMNMELKYLDNE